MAETGARQAALRFAHQRHHLSALDGLTPERIRRSSELRGSRTRSHRAAAAKDEDRRPGAEFLNERLGVRGNVPKGWHAVIVQRRSPGPVSCLKGCIVRHGHVARLAPHSNGQGSREWAIPTPPSFTRLMSLGTKVTPGTSGGTVMSASRPWEVTFTYGDRTLSRDCSDDQGPPPNRSTVPRMRMCTPSGAWARTGTMARASSTPIRMIAWMSSAACEA